MSGLVLCSADRHLAEYLKATAQRAAMAATLVQQPSQAMRLMGELSPDLILLDEQFSQGATLEFAANLMAMLPDAKVVLLLRAHNFEVVRAGMGVGVVDALLVPDGPGRVADVLSRLYQARADRAAAGRVLAFFRAKGGVGATFLAVNTAVAATALVEGKVLLIDGNLLTSDVPAMLNLKSQRTMLDLAPVLDELTPRHIEDVCAHHASGLHVLLAPPEPAMGHALAPEHLALIIRVAQRAYKAVIIDAPPVSDERCEAVLRAASRPLLVATPDALSVFAWRRLHPLVGDLGGRAGLVLNQVTVKAEFSAQELVEWTRLPLIGQVRYDPALVGPLVNTGRTLLEARSGRRFEVRPPGIIRDVVRLAHQLLGQERGATA
nr:MAG: hypothetical protein DIU55_13700 [Bacillota bacterium]